MEAEGGRLLRGGGGVDTGSHMDPNSGVGSRRHNPRWFLQRLQQSESIGDALDCASILASNGKV